MSRIKVIFFDAAGTLFHVKGSVADIYLAHAEKYGVKRTPDLANALLSEFARSGELAQERVRARLCRCAATGVCRERSERDQAVRAALVVRCGP